MTLNLKDVSVCVVDCVAPGLAMRALNLSRDLCNFGEAFFFTHELIACDDAINCVKIPAIRSLDSYSKFLMKDLNKYIKTPYVLIVQWDGYVVDPSSWSPNFLNFDYIGAKWHWHQDAKTVGNGGFSLRSKNY